jgi:hypothetical protein
VVVGAITAAGAVRLAADTADVPGQRTIGSPSTLQSSVAGSGSASAGMVVMSASSSTAASPPEAGGGGGSAMQVAETSVAAAVTTIEWRNLSARIAEVIPDQDTASDAPACYRGHLSASKLTTR